MSTQVEIPQLSHPAQLRRVAVLTWLELPRVIAAGILWILLAVPILTGLLGVPWPLVALAALPLCLYATGLAHFAAIVSRGERPMVRDAFRLDLPLGVTVELGVLAVSGLLAAGGALFVLGVVLAAVLLLVVPFALSYGAVRGRTGFSAWRGGLILVAYRPGAALTLLALNCIAAFAIVATLGTLGAVLPCYLLVYSCATVAAQLDEIDHRSGPR